MLLSFPPLTIRDAVPADAAQLTAWWNDGAVMAHAGFPNGLGVTQEQVAAGLQRPAGLDGGRLMLEHDGVPCGEMSYRRTENGDAEIGIKICDPSRQERGLGRLALSLLIGELFRMGFARIVLDTNLTNTRAQHVYELLGFEKLRVNRNAWTDQLGQLQSSVDYALLPRQFRDFCRKP